MMADDVARDKYQWSWWAAEGEAADTYSINEPTRDAVIAAARSEYGDDATFVIVEATQDGPFVTDLFDEENVEDVIERFTDANGDRFGEDGFHGYIDQHGLAAELNRAVALYMAEHGGDIVVWAFTDQRNKEVIRPGAAPPA
ncbi:hypothetical protein AI27_17940 [Sphingomonas sp. BHC-A]|nr:hypothetical protein AI27_17940 [Sphingomonas sp. BHC-A]